MECLRRRKGELAALVEVLLEGQEGTVEDAVLAASNLPALSSCSNTEGLLAATPPPEDPEEAKEVEFLRGELGRALALEGAGPYADGLRLVDELSPRVEAVAYPPLTAERLLRRGSLAMWRDDYTVASENLQQAFLTALAIKADRIAMESLAKWIYARGYGLGRPKEVLPWQTTAIAFLDRLGRPRQLHALTLNNLSTVMSASGRLHDAIDLQLKAIKLLRDASADEDPLIVIGLTNLGENYLDINQCSKADEALARALSVSPSFEDRYRARALAQLARDTLTVGHIEDALLATVGAWLDDYDPAQEPPPTLDEPARSATDG